MASGAPPPQVLVPLLEMIGPQLYVLLELLDRLR